MTGICGSFAPHPARGADSPLRPMLAALGTDAEDAISKQHAGAAVAAYGRPQAQLV